MKAFEIALFTFIFVAMVSFVQSADLGLVENPAIADVEWDAGDGKKFEDKVDGGGSGIAVLDFAKDVYDMVKILSGILVHATVKLPSMLESLGMPEGGAINVIITGCTWFMYGIGIFQLLTNRNIRLQE